MIKKIYYSKWFPRFLYKKYDGGIDSGVIGYMLLEWKILFSIGFLKFNKGSREAFHNHAFNAITWWLKGSVTEEHVTGEQKYFNRSIKPKITKRECFHKVVAHCDTWAITFRGPWNDTWKELRKQEEVILTHGRKLVKKI